MLKKAIVSVSCKLLSWNLCILLTHWPKSIIRRAQVLEILICQRYQVFNEEGGIPYPRVRWLGWPNIINTF